MKFRWTKNRFVEQSILTHGNVYDYSKSNYLNYHSKLEIICQHHGSFWQTPQNHIAGRGCKRCNRGEVFDTDDFVKKSKKIHGNKYDYNETKYTENRKPVKIVCKIHGRFFQLANTHLRGSGCSKCGNLDSSKSQKSSKYKFLEDAKKIHGNTYDYSNVSYNQTHKKISIKCKKHGNFFQTPHNHITNKQGCPYCVHTVSKPEIEFLDFEKIPNTTENRQKHIYGFRVDGINNNTVYEFFGDYYHGNPSVYSPNKYNKTCHKTFGELHQNTIRKINRLKEIGYDIKYVWEMDWRDFKRGITTTPKIITV